MNKENLTVLLITLVFIALGFGVTVLNWQMALDEGKYYQMTAFIGPFIGFLGLAMLVGPPAKPAEAQEDEIASRHRTLRQRLAMATVAVGIIAGGVNFALMNGWIGSMVK